MFRGISDSPCRAAAQGRFFSKMPAGLSASHPGHMSTMYHCPPAHCPQNFNHCHEDADTCRTPPRCANQDGQHIHIHTGAGPCAPPGWGAFPYGGPYCQPAGQWPTHPPYWPTSTPPCPVPEIPELQAPWNDTTPNPGFPLAINANQPVDALFLRQNQPRLIGPVNIKIIALTGGAAKLQLFLTAIPKGRTVRMELSVVPTGCTILLAGYPMTALISGQVVSFVMPFHGITASGSCELQLAPGRKRLFVHVTTHP
jgi:hypothetical protein